MRIEALDDTESTFGTQSTTQRHGRLFYSRSSTRRYVHAFLSFAAAASRDPIRVPSWAWVQRDDFCPVTSVTTGRENRAARRKIRMIKRPGRRILVCRTPHELLRRPLLQQGHFILPQEYVDTLKGAYPDRSYYGGPDYNCVFCGAMFWYGERVQRSSSYGNHRIVYNGCCRGGRVVLPPQKPFPEPLKSLVRFDAGAKSNKFMKLIRHYNSVFAFTSLGVHVDNSINTGDGPYIFRINGVVHHRIGSLLPPDGNKPEFAQLYIYDTDNELANRLNLLADDSSGSLDPEIVKSLMNMLNQHNALVGKFRMARDRMVSPSAPEICIKLNGTVNVPGDVYCLPVASELAALIVGGLTPDCSSFDVIVESQSSYLKRISPIHPALMALQYPLLFPYGELGFHIGIRLNLTEDDNLGGRQFASMTEYYAYQAHYRPNQPNPILCSGRLSQQYVVNAYSCIESNRLSYYYFNQSSLRSETYQGISDAMGKGALTGKDVGVKTILPANFIGGKRYMKANMHDCMAICCAYGPPDIFTTMTCNSNWLEIKEALKYEPGQKPSDRADVVVRVYHMKLNEYLQDIKDGRIYGPVNAVAHTNEFQKRGLPHTHVLVWKKGTDRQPCASEVDSMISAELPDPMQDPLGYALVSEFMMHGPCGSANPKSPCMKDGICSKKFPKPFRNETTFDPDGYPLYRRRDTGLTVIKNNVALDNRYVVPHNLYALKKYQCHINSESCNKTYLIKYLFKYVNKGFDCAKFKLKPKPNGATSQQCPNVESEVSENSDDGIDEIAEYIKSRYLSWFEGEFRLLGFEIHGKFPPVERLYVHLPGFNIVTVHEDVPLQAVVQSEELKKSTLTEWFIANQKTDYGHDLTYCEFPSRFRWDDSKKKWVKRTRGFQLGRIRYVHPTAGEVFYLRMLLMVVRGATSYEDVRTYEGKVYNTFRDACQARGLIGDDTEWVALFNEVVQWATAHQIRNLFMTVLAFCDVGNVRSLFDKYWRYMADDISYRIRRSSVNSSYQIPDADLQNALLKELSDMFSANGLSICSYNLPPIPTSSLILSENRLIVEEIMNNTWGLKDEAKKMVASLNTEQKSIFDVVTDGVMQKKNFLYFVSGHGGTGKTFLWNTILASLRSEGHIVLAVASCGVASLLMPGGRTAHSRFKIPLDINEYSQCSMGRGTNLAALVLRCSLIIWDEAPMTHKHCFECLDRTLRDVLSHVNPGSTLMPFGGKPILFGGDFRQVLPVIQGGTRSQILSASLLGSYLWKNVTVLRLIRNMRLDSPLLSANQREDMKRFANWVLAVGEGRLNILPDDNCDDKNLITIPDEYVITTEGPNIPAIADYVYDNFLESYLSQRYLADRSIICPTNSVVDEVNEFMVHKLPAKSKEYLSYDTIANSAEQPSDFELLYPPEFLNSININNFPQHKLVLKVGVPVVILRNINQAGGLCNGTRLIIERLGERVLEGRVITGNHIGEVVAIPRIMLNGSSPKWPFTLQRRQFPVRVSYAMTINKCQGQTLARVGVYLREPVFTHGQLYVAVSRVSSRNGLKILIEDENGKTSNKTRNIVYEEVLQYV